MMQGALRNKLAELQNNRRSPRKRTAPAADDKVKSSNERKLYTPPQKRRQKLLEPDKNQEEVNKGTAGMKEEVVVGQQQQKQQPPPELPKLDLSLFDMEEFANRSWLDMIEEEEQRKAMEEEETKKVEEGGGGQEPENNIKLELGDLEYVGECDWVDLVNEEEAKEKRRREEQRQLEEQQQQLPAEESVKNPEEIKEEHPEDPEQINPEPEMVSSLPKEDGSGTHPSTPSRNGAMSSCSNSSAAMYTPNPKDGWTDPKRGWCTDPKTVERRTKELQKMKERPAYKRYLSMVPKFERKKDKLPNTPNKWMNWPRRSWDQQVKKWKLAVYEWAGLTPTPSVAGSYCSSECSDNERDNDQNLMSRAPTPSSAGPSTPKRIKMEGGGDEQKGGNSRAKLVKQEPEQQQREVKIVMATSDTLMANMLDHFYMDSQRGEPTMMENTLATAATAGGEGEDTTTLKEAPAVKSYAGAVVAAKPAATEVAASATEAKAATARRSYATVAKGPTDFSHMVVKKEVKVEEQSSKRPKLVPKKRGRPPKKAN